MTIATFERFTTVPKEKIFQVATNFSSFQKWLPQYFPSVRIISVRPSTILAEEHRMMAGKELVVMAKHMVDDPFTHKTFFVGGDAKGSQIIEKYEQTSQGTKITVTVDFKPKMSMRVSEIFGSVKFVDEFEKIVDKLIEISEN